MSWTTSLADLRELLNDGDDDRYVYRKKVFGQQNGTNKTFKTFEFRRVTNFTDATLSAAPLGVYINGVRLDPTKIVSDDIKTGEFTLATSQTAPAVTDQVRATYYTEQFLDAELNTFITRATQSLQLGNDPTNVDPALRDAVLYYAASEGMKKIAMRWTQRASDAFLLEDAPKKEALGVAETYAKLSSDYYKEAFKRRDDFYTRAGQALAPNFQTSWGAVGAVTPRR